MKAMFIPAPAVEVAPGVWVHSHSHFTVAQSCEVVTGGNAAGLWHSWLRLFFPRPNRRGRRLFFFLAVSPFGKQFA